MAPEFRVCVNWFCFDSQLISLPAFAKCTSNIETLGVKTTEIHKSMGI